MQLFESSFAFAPEHTNILFVASVIPNLWSGALNSRIITNENRHGIKVWASVDAQRHNSAGSRDSRVYSHSRLSIRTW